MSRLTALVAGVMAAAVGLAGCSSIAGSAAGDFAGNLSTAILDHDDPELVREGLPAYLLLLDSLAAKPEASPTVLGAAARLYAAYAVIFVNDPARAATLAARSRDYGDRASCVARAASCGLRALPVAELEARLADLDAGEAAPLFSTAVGWLAYMRTHDGYWQALADLPRVEAVLKRLLVIGDPADAGSVNAYLGILNTLRPPALGGKPEQGRAYFDKAVELTAGRDLSVLVDYARSYARLVYDRELHDSLLNQVMAADPRQDGHTLLNILAQRQAAELLASADDYF